MPLVTPSPVPGPAAQHAARDLLRRAEYHRDDPSVFDRAWNWLLDRLDELFRGTPGGTLTLILLVIVAAAVVFALVKAGPPRRRLRAPGDVLAPSAEVDHRARAAALEAEGRHADALREWLRAAVRTIEERGVLPPRPGRTGRATAREAGPLLPAAARPLATATAAFDEVWFGGRAATAADAAAGRSAADAVREARIAAAVSGTGYAIPW